MRHKSVLSKLADKNFHNLIREEFQKRRALGMREVFTSILARGQGELPDFLHRRFFTAMQLGLS
jgi:hypothetical protein